MKAASFVPVIGAISPDAADGVPGLTEAVSFWTSGRPAAEWFREMEECWGTAGYVVRRGDEVQGFVVYGPPERFPRVREYPLGPFADDAAMLAYVATDGCRMRFLREQLDDPEAVDCGRCDNCGGLQLKADVSGAALEEAGERLRRPGVTIAPRKMWPSALTNLGIDLKGKITSGAEPGRAVGRLTDLGHGQALRALFRPDSEDGPVPRPLVDAVLEVLSDWHPDWPARPTGVAYVESARRPQLTRNLADGLARYLQLPLVARWQVVDPGVAPGQGTANSAQRVAAVGRRFALAVDQPLDGGPVLLVDDLVGTGWTLTMAARALRAAGASAVLPLTLGVES